MSKDSMVYKMNMQGSIAGKKVLARLADICERPRETTEQLLLKILNDNAGTEYGKKYHFDQIHSLDDYRKYVPVITYEDIADDIERLKNGEKNILTAYNFKHMNETSGTSGKKKAVPLTDEQCKVYMDYSNQITLGVLSENLGENWMDGRSFCTSEGTHTTLPTGVTLGCASSIMADACKGGVEPYGSMLKSMYTSPAEAMSPGPGVDTKYIHTRFAMADENVTGITSGFISTVLSLMCYIHDHYEVLINDIEKGTIDSSIEMDYETKSALLKKIVPMPERGARLREIFKNGADIQFVPLVWPNMKYINCAGGDGFTVYDNTMRNLFTGDKIHRVYSGVTASEGLWSTPIATDTLESVLVPDSAVMEFQPVEYESDFSHIKQIDELEIGKVYELVITNLCGYYRYRMSDAVQVVGFYKKTPLVKFMYRVNKTINLVCEKTTEYALRITAENTAKRLGFDLLDYEVYPDTSIMPPRYTFLIEAPDDVVNKISKAELDKVVNEELCKENAEFAECLHDNQIQAPDCYFEQGETQLLYTDLRVLKGASPSQVKPIHVISNDEELKFFMAMRNLWD